MTMFQKNLNKKRKRDFIREFKIIKYAKILPHLYLKFCLAYR